MIIWTMEFIVAAGSLVSLSCIPARRPERDVNDSGFVGQASPKINKVEFPFIALNV